MSTVPVFDPTGSRLTEDFDAVFREHYRFVYRTAYRITRSAEDAEDILQTVFLRLLRLGLTEGFKENPKAYLYRASVNASLDTVRSRQRRTLNADPESYAASVKNVGECGDEAIYEKLYQAIAELTPASAEIFTLRYVHNYSDAQIAKLLGTSRGTIAVSLYRSRARLKKLIRSVIGESS